MPHPAATYPTWVMAITPGLRSATATPASARRSTSASSRPVAPARSSSQPSRKRWTSSHAKSRPNTTMPSIRVKSIVPSIVGSSRVMVAVWCRERHQSTE